jgi:hypothetical protein
MNQIVIFYGNFSEVQKCANLPEIKAAKYSCMWLRLYYNVFLTNKFNQLIIQNKESSETVIQYLAKFEIKYSENLKNDSFPGFDNNLVKLFWEWTSKNSFNNDNSNTDIYELNSKYYVQQYNGSLTMEQSAIVLSGILVSLIDFKKMDPLTNEYKIVFICHDKHIGLPGKDTALNENQKNKFAALVKTKLGTKLENEVLKNISFEEVISFQHEKTSLTIQSFNGFWDINVDLLLSNYRKELTKKNFIDLKNYIIHIFLPLAIDIQGLREVQNENYFNDIKSSLMAKVDGNISHSGLLNTFPGNGFSGSWYEIMGAIPSNYKDFSPQNLVSEILNSDYNKFSKSKYFDPQNEWFLSNWLKCIVSVVNKRIKQQQQ